MANITDKNGIASTIVDTVREQNSEGLSLMTNDLIDITDNANNILLVYIFIWNLIRSQLNLQEDRNGDSS